MARDHIKISIYTRPDPYCDASTHRTWPRALSLATVKRLWARVGYPNNGAYLFDFQGKLLDSEDFDA